MTRFDLYRSQQQCFIASGEISSLTGYPRDLWGRELLVMFKAFVDDSKSDTGDRRFYLCGYMHFASAWEQFVEDWRTALQEAPAISYFHAVDAHARVDEFGGWDDIAKDNKLKSLAAVIQKHKPWTFEVSLSLNDFDRLFKPSATYILKNPYFICFYAVVIRLALFHKELEIDFPISFVFDEQGTIGLEAVQWYAYMKASHPQLENILKTSPIFESDKTVQPLQAADMLAWHIRRRSEGRDEELPVYSDLFPHDHIVIDIPAELLEQWGKSMAEMPGIEFSQTKKQWKRMKIGIIKDLLGGIWPDTGHILEPNPIKRFFKKIKFAIEHGVYPSKRNSSNAAKKINARKQKGRKAH